MKGIFAIMAVWLLATGCVNSQFLDTRIPAYCQHDLVRCRIWAQHHVRYQSSLRVARLPGLQRYLQSIVDRLVRANRLPTHPTVRLVYDDVTSAHDNLIDVEVGRLALLANEAEAAGMLAHELIHIVGEHSNNAIVAAAHSSLLSPQRLDYSRNLEQVADERATQLLVNAGYHPEGMLQALRTLLATCAPRWMPGNNPDFCDDTHPPYFARLASVALAIAQQPQASSYLGRAAFLAALDGVPLRSPHQPVNVVAPGTDSFAWVHHDTRLAYRRDGALVTNAGYAASYGQLIAATLLASTTSTRNGRTVVRGYWSTSRERSYLHPAGENQDGDAASVMRLAAVDSFEGDYDAYVAVIFAHGFALVFWGANEDLDAVEHSVASVHDASAVELAAQQPTVRIKHAVLAGRWRDVGAATCGDGIELEPAERLVVMGEPVKCFAR
ncbi:MAG TPA: hypothetical protein PLF40_19475 [Kofleriaceae bacterium]|nr:hypothetical protein [Kofleriaceae bacterium]